MAVSVMVLASMVVSVPDFVADMALVIQAASIVINGRQYCEFKGFITRQMLITKAKQIM